MMNSIKEYINKLENESFEGWTEEAKNGYLTACTSIKAKFNNSNSYLNDRLAIERLKREYREHGKLICGFDFDSTIYDYHKKGLELQPVIDLLKKCSDLGFTMCLYSLSLKDSTMDLNDKVKYCNELGIKVLYINESPVLHQQVRKLYKPYFNILLDDRAGLSSAYNILLTTLNELKL